LSTEDGKKKMKCLIDIYASGLPVQIKLSVCASQGLSCLC